MSNIFGLHMHRTRRSQSQFEKEGTQSGDGIPLSTERVIQCGEGGLHVDERVLPIVHVDLVPHRRKPGKRQAIEEAVTQVAEPPRRKDRVPSFTETVTHSEERGSHADEQHLRTTHASHEEVPVSAITQSKEGGTQSGDGTTHASHKEVPVLVDPVPHRRKRGRHQATEEAVT
ncbi:unnamed protein product [Camellia sinensis]